MRVLITGVSGQLGYYLAQACEKAGAEVFDIVQPQAGVHLLGGTEKELLFVHVVDGDQCDVRSLLRIKEEVKPDVVFALGALSVPAYASYLLAVNQVSEGQHCHWPRRSQSKADIRRLQSSPPQ